MVRNKVVLATGYNGSTRGAPHCDVHGHLIVDSHCVRTVHAEANAVAQAARMGHAIDGATVYVTHRPCFYCIKLLANAGVVQVHFDAEYGAREYPEHPYDVRVTGPHKTLEVSDVLPKL